MYYRFFKRIEDIVFSLLILIIFSPILISFSILSLLLEGWPVFYISRRMVGLNKVINIVKFRTMKREAKSEKYGLEKKYMKDGYLDIPIGSEVFTPIGRILEKTQLVEVPQAFAVLWGKISFVGNRPLPMKNIELLKKKYPENWEGRFKSPAGITGISQVVGKFELSPKQRLELECLYSKVYEEGNVLKADAYIFFSTIIFLLFRSPVAYRSYESAKNILLSCLNK